MYSMQLVSTVQYVGMYTDMMVAKVGKIVFDNVGNLYSGYGKHPRSYIDTFVTFVETSQLNAFTREKGSWKTQAEGKGKSKKSGG